MDAPATSQTGAYLEDVNMGKTSIEWASHTWNPLTWNCTKVSQACKNCYAMVMAERFGGKNSNGGDFLKHPSVWIGTSVEENKTIHRLDSLIQFYNAPGRFVSAEPLLSALVRIENYLKPLDWAVPVNWVIAGGESGANRRAELWNLDNVRHLRDACIKYGVPFMYKQGLHFKSGQDRILDGRTWDETPFEDAPAPHIEPVQQEMF